MGTFSNLTSSRKVQGKAFPLPGTSSRALNSILKVNNILYRGNLIQSLVTGANSSLKCPSAGALRCSSQQLTGGGERVNLELKGLKCFQFKAEAQEGISG